MPEPHRGRARHIASTSSCDLVLGAPLCGTIGARSELSMEPFQIHVGEEVLDDLRLRLRETRWTHVDGAPSWELGTHPAYLRQLVTYWRVGYDFRAREAELNALPQFKAQVDDASLHFVHLRGRGLHPTPLLLLHGWPDSFYRFSKVMRRLADPASVGGDVRDAFDIVVPSLPGFAFTGSVPVPPGTAPTRHAARLIARLMTDVLGYRRFAVAGGDGGSALAQIMAIEDPAAILGVHLTDLGWHASKVDPATLSKPERKYLEAAKKQFMADGAYAMLQTTRPRSLSPALDDSPVGLASWIIDRFHAWSDSHGDLERSFSKDDLLTNIMLYWVTQTIGSSMFNYFAERRSPSLTPADRVERPVGLALFPKDIGGIPPRRFAERTLNVQRWTEMPRGGHFAALEEPELYARDVAEFFRPLRARSAREQEPHHVHPAV
jgi:pimeloyl-ACP methyl ester carboxylesterase